ncbi:transglycosylase SLT domain-containing protein [Dyella sp. RRB7]|uniref:transglycosylase SLT domain-containing protein n=1 Tax=Dyella sp. RRB7 TaxID=2919502 RepID=UPI001FA997CA|nr:transglycosylase SLT domain-containing protein [Dyella sp. RRB7]
MTTVVEALFITLGLDTRDFDKKKEGVTTSLTKLGEASDKQTKTITESGKKAANAFSMLKIEVLGALAAFGMTTSFKDFITTNINGQAALGRLSANLGMSTQKLEAWKLAAKEMGQSGEDAVGALQSVAKGVAEARITGHSALTDASRRFGFAIDTKDNEQTLINISRRMAQTHDRQQALMIAEAAGVGNIANLLLQGPDKLQAQLAHTMSLTGAATKESTEQAAKLQAQWADLQERFQQVGERVFARLEPVLARLGERLANWLDKVDWQKVIDGISRFIDKVNEVVKEMGGWKTIAEILGGVLALKLLSPLLNLVGVFGRLIPLLGSATAGATAMAGAFSTIGATVGLAAAAFAGWKLGEWISNNMSPQLQEQVGRFTATLAALAGDKDAQQAINQEKKSSAIDAARNDPNVSDDVKRAAAGKSSLSDPAIIRLLAMHERARAKASGQPEAGPLIGSDFMGKFDPMHSRTFTGPNGNATLFGMLENKYGLPAGMLAKKFETESGNGTHLISRAGALGPMQFMPATATEFGLTTGLNGTVMDLDKSAEAAAKYMAQLHKQFGDWDKAQAAYNWGGSNLSRAIAAYGDKWLEHAPSETQAYVNKGYLKSVPMSPQTPAMSAAQRSGGNTDNSSSVSIGTLNVNAPKATDANGVAKGMQSALRSNSLVNPFTKGLT